MAELIVALDVQSRAEAVEKAGRKMSKANKEKDAPKSMDLVVSKATGLPISLKTRISGVTVTIHDLRPGVSEKDVTFRLEDYPGAKVVDKR